MAAFITRTAANAISFRASPVIHKGSVPVNRPPLDTIQSIGPLQIVSLRAPQYGIPLAQRRTFLQTLLPNGSASYVGLFSTAPDRAGLNGVECSGGAYTRIAHSVWRHSTVGGFVARRSNIGLITWPAMTTVIMAEAWGAWDASTGGNLVAFGLLRNVDLQARTFEFDVGEIPQFGDGLLRTGIQ